MVQPDRQGAPPLDPASCVARCRAEQWGGRGGPHERRTVRGSGERYLQELHERLKDGSYQPHPVKRVEIPKGDGKTRPLGIPTVRDRVVQAALKMVIEPIFEIQFRPGSFGFRPGRGCKDALREVDRLIREGYTHVVDADLKGYFDSIPHDRLMALVAGSISDGRVLSLIELFLKQDIMSETARWTPASGTPQGAVLSPLLANLYLHPLDLLMEEAGHHMVRYADDFVILCRTAAEADAVLARVRAWVDANGLTLHPTKTHVGDCSQPGQGFEFLGYRFEAGQRRVRQKSLNALKDRVRARTIRSRGDSLGRIIADINPILRGWFGYFNTLNRPGDVPADRPDDPAPAACHPAQAGAPARHGTRQGRPPEMDQRLLRKPGTVHFGTQPWGKRDTPDEETSNWRAVCGRTARTVRRAGRETFPTPISADPWRTTTSGYCKSQTESRFRNSEFVISLFCQSVICPRGPMNATGPSHPQRDTDRPAGLGKTRSPDPGRSASCASRIDASRPLRGASGRGGRGSDA